MISECLFLFIFLVLQEKYNEPIKKSTFI